MWGECRALQTCFPCLTPPSELPPAKWLCPTQQGVPANRPESDVKSGLAGWAKKAGGGAAGQVEASVGQRGGGGAWAGIGRVVGTLI